ncbi:hypothetical protein BST23_06295 [Mycolicibacterium elephantis]|uniref:AMP-binding enzyme C-terminal domain-containing protein n=1 Tax=Mycolicibacterium elephantis TaxID=81858 RepID=A0A1X0D4U8_9MYCO|nr:hypothetical protein BST23_06295 [Mycolicibacterium elephantis]
MSTDTLWPAAHGFIGLAGRAKDLIIRGGHNIDPALIEDAPLAHPDVTAAAAVARPDVHSGEVPVEFGTVRPGATVTGDGLTAFVGERISERAATIDAIPMTDVGKPYKVPLRATTAQHALADQRGVLQIVGQFSAGAPVVVLTLGQAADRAEVERVVKSFAVNDEMYQQ